MHNINTHIFNTHSHSADRLEKLLVTYLKPFPRCAGPLLVKRPLGGPPILPTDSLCVNPNFRALVRVIQYSKHTAVSSDMLELDWQVRMGGCGAYTVSLFTRVWKVSRCQRLDCLAAPFCYAKSNDSTFAPCI